MQCLPQGDYRPRNPQASPLYHLVEDHFDELERVWDERYEREHGFWRPVVEQFLLIGDGPVIEKILQHLKLWNRPEHPRPPPAAQRVHYDQEIVDPDDAG